MTLLKTNSPGAVGEAAVSELVVEPLIANSALAQVATVLTGIQGSSLRVPVITDDNAGVTLAAEGGELSIANPELNEVELFFRKIGTVVPISSELVEDSHRAGGGVLEITGRSLARGVASRIDDESFGGAASPNGWAGIETVAALDAGETDLLSVDAFQDGISLIRKNGGTPKFLVTNPDTYAELSKAKTGTGSAVPLLGQSASDALAASVAGLQVVVSQHIADSTAYVIDPSAIIFAIRRDAELITDRSFFFGSDRFALRITLRAAVGFIRPSGIARVAVAA